MTPLRTMICCLALAATAVSSKALAQIAPPNSTIRNGQLWISLACGRDCLWDFGRAGNAASNQFAPPVFEIDGKRVPAHIRSFVPADPVKLGSDVTLYGFEGAFAEDPHSKLRIEFQVNEGTPILRFRYVLEADAPRKLTESTGRNSLTYLETSLRQLPDAEEVSLSNFVEATHSYAPIERKIYDSSFEDGTRLMGPILASSNGSSSFLIAYEHGSQTPDAFLQFELGSDRRVRLVAVKGNYVSCQVLDSNHSYTTVWMEAGATAGNIDQLASVYRRFVLKYMAENLTSRLPYIFYNTWNYQERNKWWNGKSYTESLNQERILEEVDIAHRMGVEVFVIDAGWQAKTGDWTVDNKRFPNGLKDVQAKLDGYGMKLGLWFGPTSAAVSSAAVREHPEWRMSHNGVIGSPKEIWETEASYQMCIESGYADYFADQLIRLAKTLGVRYFKWDAMSQYACNDPHHNHGSDNDTPEERSDAYAFQLVNFMRYIADKVAAAVPGTIVDFDVTENLRPFGLAWLASGKYFAINNGPYTFNLDYPTNAATTNLNFFFYPGQARTWIARAPLAFDKWIPSVLFLTHYFPDDPGRLQELNIASLILGQGGIWGDLPKVSDTGVDFIGGLIKRYKLVRDDITESDPVVSGIISGSPEIHEKISATTGRGTVVVFATARGTYDYVTEHKTTNEHWSSDGVTLSRDEEGRAKIEATFERPGAKIIFFGVE